MKKTFEHLPEAKRERVIRALIEEFAEGGWDKSSTYGIIRRAGISKGGLYEYTSSKEELFLFTVDYAYTALYRHIRKTTAGNPLPMDLLERLRMAAEKAVDFYIVNPEYVELIEKTYHIYDSELAAKVAKIFQGQYDSLFSEVDYSGIKCDRGRLQSLSKWILQKTRYEFLLEWDRFKKEGGDTEELKRRYMDNWNFYLGVLRDGAYY